METGYIRVQTRTGGVLPVAGVFIRITAENGRTVSEFFTDESGNGTPLTVSAPEVSLSLTPQTATRPYAVYSLYAWKQGYAEIEVNGIQVFAGQTSLQTLELQPADARSVPAQQTYNIPQHHLFAPGGVRASSAPLEGCTVPRVLSQVVIPTYITVHLGTPASYASDVTVSFRDYIKNVASSEIYPTWPAQSLRANIYCHISLALNRVFTEWYRSKGYSFQITNSTSYDQYFVYGRNIFENISEIVDQIFSTYVRRPGTVNPYYTEYCDGQSVSCPGLKQWGTVTLANQGYSALNILKYYYGSNIELVTSGNIASIPTSYPGTALRVGSTGAAVRTLQRQLRRIAQNYPAFGQVTEDGVFGSGTAAAVRAFQRQFGLTADGVVGYATWYAISYVYVAVKRLAELGSEGEAANGDPVDDAGSAWGGQNLTVGSTGTAVRQVQYWLDTVRGYISGLPFLRVDGVYGAETAQAVRVFQTWAGLTADGVVGQTTWNRLYRAFASVVQDENTELGYATQYPGTPLRTGSTGRAVRSVQFWLSVISDRYPSIGAVTVDGVFGSATAASVRAFQNYFGLTVDGVVGPATWNKLRELFVNVVLSLSATGSYPGTYPGTPLQRGSDGRAVREMQYYLHVLSLYYTSIPRISYDGVFGTATRQAVIAFQNLFGLTADGVVGPATWSALYAAYVRIITVEGGYRGGERPAFTQTLQSGSTGPTVLWVQEMLTFLSLFDPTVPPPLSLPAETGPETVPEPGVYDDPGVYGEITAAAVRAFRRSVGLPAADTVDLQTYLQLTAAFDAADAQDLYGEAEPDDRYPDTVLRDGAAGPLVRQLQQQLNTLAEDYCGVRFVAEDGVFGQQTAQAVESFQRSAGLPVSGSVTEATRQALKEAIDGNALSCGYCSAAANAPSAVMRPVTDSAESSLSAGSAAADDPVTDAGAAEEDVPMTAVPVLPEDDGGFRLAF